MKITQYLSSSLFLCLLGFIPCMAFAQADGAPERAPELQVLERVVGVWNVEVMIKLPDGKEFTNDFVSHRSWTLGGTFVQFQDTNFSDPRAKEFQLLWTYDPVAKNYPAVFMDGPNRGELTGVWDAKKNTMHWQGKGPNGVTAEGHDRFLGKDRIEASGIFRNAEGDTVFEISWSQPRRKAKSPKK